MTYVDGVLVAVPASKKDRYVSFAKDMAVFFTDCGASEVVDCWGDDVPEGKLTSFPLALQRQPDEVVIFSWILWPSRAARDAGWEKAMKDPRMAAMPDDLFDGKRMIFGGFDVIQSTRKGV